jgi:hypothetical protein
MSQVGRQRVAKLHDRRVLAGILHEKFIDVVNGGQVSGANGDRPPGDIRVELPDCLTVEGMKQQEMRDDRVTTFGASSSGVRGG